jgi:hypothetical protein
MYRLRNLQTILVTVVKILLKIDYATNRLSQLVIFYIKNEILTKPNYKNK